MAILKELWTGDVNAPETKTTYEYVLDLRNRPEETCQQLIRISRYKMYYDRKSKSRSLNTGDRVLLSLPTERNKLLLQWKGPFPVVDVVSLTDYRIDINGKRKVFHINLLKQYHERGTEAETTDETQTVGETQDTAATAVIEDDEVSTPDHTLHSLSN